MLRVTHLSRRRDNWPWDLDDDGWCIRFAGSPDTDEWDDMREELKSWGRDYARWLPNYEWDDSKVGAWWIDDGLFRDSYTDRFTHLQEAIDALQRQGRQTQWIWHRSYGYTSTPHQDTHSHTYEPPPRQIPAHLIQEYALLGVGASVTLKEVKDAYRALAKKYHPDAGGTHHGFIALQQAYERVSQWVEIHERIAV